MTFLTEKLLNKFLPGHRRDDFARVRRFSRDILALYIAATSNCCCPISHRLLESLRAADASQQTRCLLREHNRLLARLLARGWAIQHGEKAGGGVEFNRAFARNARARDLFIRFARVHKRLAKALMKVRA